MTDQANKTTPTENPPEGAAPEPPPQFAFIIPQPMLQAAVDQIRFSTSPNRTIEEVNQLLQAMANLQRVRVSPTPQGEPPPPKAPNRSTRRKAAAKKPSAKRGRRPKG